MSGRRIRAITTRILAQFRHDRRTVALLFVAPIVILGLLNFLLRGSGTRAELGVVDLDRGLVSRAVRHQLEVSALVKSTRLDRDSAEQRLHDGTIAAYVLLPAGFSDQVLSQHRLVPEVHLEGSQPSQTGSVLQAVNQAMLAAAGSAPTATAAPRFEPRISYLYGGPGLDTLDYFGGAFIGLIVFFLVFVVTSVAFLRERSQGTLERLMASPLRRGEIVAGYMLGFTALALAQSAEVLLFALYVVKVHNSGSVLLIFFVEVLLAIAAVNLGIFLSMFARTEFQAVQFIPLVIAPQLLLSGVIVPVSQEPGWLQVVSNLLPLTYAVNGLRDVMIKGAALSSGSLQLDILVMVGFGTLMVVLASLTLRRRVA